MPYITTETEHNFGDRDDWVSRKTAGHWLDINRNPGHIDGHNVLSQLELFDSDNLFKCGFLVYDRPIPGFLSNRGLTAVIYDRVSQVHCDMETNCINEIWSGVSWTQAGSDTIIYYVYNVSSDRICVRMTGPDYDRPQPVFNHGVRVESAYFAIPYRGHILTDPYTDQKLMTIQDVMTIDPTGLSDRQVKAVRIAVGDPESQIRIFPYSEKIPVNDFHEFLSERDETAYWTFIAMTKMTEIRHLAWRDKMVESEDPHYK